MPRLLALLCLSAALSPSAGLGQSSVPPNQVTPLIDPSSLRPPAGAKVAVIEYEDLECPFCARAFPAVHAAARHYGIPVEEYDFQIPSHHWSHQAAIFAHYLKAKVSPELAEEYRRELFASQFRVETPEDLQKFTAEFMRQHGKPMPTVVDPAGEFDREVKADTAKGMTVGIRETPTIFVVTANHWIQVRDFDQIATAIEQAEAEAAKAGSSAGR